jgi:hypothetical protein
MRYQTNEIISMAIVYEGHLPQGHTLDVHALASEIMDKAHQENQLAEIQLSPHTIVKAQRADELKFYSGSYEPADDLPRMLQECIREIRADMLAHGEIPDVMSVKNLVFKSWSSLVSTVWVGLYVKSDAQSDALQIDTLDEDLITGSAGTLQDAAQSVGRPVVPVSAPAKPERHIRKGFLWQAAFWIGILMLITGCLLAGIVLYSLVSSPSDPVDWPVIFGCTGAATILGGLLVFLATRPPRP